MEPMTNVERIMLLGLVCMGCVFVTLPLIIEVQQDLVEAPADLTNRELLELINKRLDSVPEPPEPCTIIDKDQLLKLNDRGYIKYSDLIFYVEYRKGETEFTSLSIMAPYDGSLFPHTPWGKCSVQEYEGLDECNIEKSDLTELGKKKFAAEVKREMNMYKDMETYQGAL